MPKRIGSVRGALRPVGPEPAAVYWRRRVAVLVTIALAVALLVVGVSQLFGGDAGAVSSAEVSQGASGVGGGTDASPPSQATFDPSATPGAQTRATVGAAPTLQPSSTDDSAAPPTESVDEGATEQPPPAGRRDEGSPACGTEHVQVTLTADARRYLPGGTPVLRLDITNLTSDPCVIDVGPGAIEFRVSSGADQIWSSDDCGAPTDGNVIELPAGKTARSTVEWPRVWSTNAACEGDRREAQPGSYTISSRVGQMSAPAVGIILA